MLLRIVFFVTVLTLTSPAVQAFAGSDQCQSCHQAEYKAWQGSHHQLAMQRVSAETVLGDFSGATFTYDGRDHRFFTQDGKYMVHTDGKDGEMQDFEVSYTFGVHPLQQYLVEFPDGRYQALNIAWDSRPPAQGGQRWFHLYPDESIDHEDPLHWTGPGFNWNFMCADCHSTGLEKNYSDGEDSFETQWSEISVGCESCHGPSEKHIEWASLDDELKNQDISRGLNFLLDDRKNISWQFSSGNKTANRTPSGHQGKEIQQCASCHSRRSSIKTGSESSPEFLEYHSPALLTEGLYFDDGQIRDEVYVWGSFVQSKMYAEGVTCSNCHNPHSLDTVASGDAVCAQCHLPQEFAVEEHHHHPQGSSGASCLNCHMPETTYMEVDPRRDHSFRIPRPDQSQEYGAPNACGRCHEDQTEDWVLEHFSNWYPNAREPFQSWAPAIHAARSGSPNAENLLAAIIGDGQIPGLARASSMLELGHLLSATSAPLVQQGLSDSDPLVRYASLQTLEQFAPQSRFSAAEHLLDDPVRMVRIEAARVLAPAIQFATSTGQQQKFQSALSEYIAAQELNADRVESRINLGNLYRNLGDPGQAEIQFRKGIRLNKKFPAAYINLSDLYREQEMAELSIKVLGEGISDNPKEGTLHHALGLALVRQGNIGIALAALERAVSLAPDVARFAYVYGIALNSSGRSEDGLAVLETAHLANPGDRDIIFALVTMNRDLKRIELAVTWAQKLVALNPSDPSAVQLLQSLQP
jgi:Flp pilus assembly protein TadD